MSACSLSLPGVTPSPSPDPRAEVQDLLDARAEALSGGDLDAYLHPLSDAARSVEAPLARSALAAPLTSFEMDLQPSARPDDSGTFEDAAVELTYLHDGLPPDNIFRIPLRYDIEPSGEGWTIVASTVHAGFTLPPWATGEIRTERSVHFLGLFRPGTPEITSTLALAEQARAALAPVVAEPLEPVHLILLARDGAEYDQMVTSAARRGSVAQAETTFEVRTDSIFVRSRHIVVNLAALSRQPSPLEVLQHELAHLSLSRLNRPFLPGWVGESAAMFLAGQRPDDTWRFGARAGSFAGLSFETLSREMNLGAHDPTLRSATLEYAYSAAAAYWLTETYGAEAFWRFYSKYAEVPAASVYPLLPPGAEDLTAPLSDLASQTTEEALLEVFGLDFGSLDAGVRGWIGRRPGG